MSNESVVLLSFFLSVFLARARVQRAECNVFLGNKEERKTPNGIPSVELRAQISREPRRSTAESARSFQTAFSAGEISLSAETAAWRGARYSDVAASETPRIDGEARESGAKV